LNTGTPSANGDINIGPNGHTPSGWVPNNNSTSPGQGSGTDPGVGKPEPPRREPEPKPVVVAPPPPPEPRKISVAVCSASGLLPNKHCEKTHKKTFVEGQEPTRTCTECKEKVHVSRLADRAEPVLVRDARVDVPGSVEEGLSVSVRVNFTITEDGGVTDASVASSSGNKLIDRAAVSAVQKRKYQPAVQDGIPRSVKRSVTFRINT
jgi:TonB family protein